MKPEHLWHAVKAWAVIAIVALPTLLATPAVKDFVTAHPADAVYLTGISGLLSALYKAYTERQASAG